MYKTRIEAQEAAKRRDRNVGAAMVKYYEEMHRVGRMRGTQVRGILFIEFDERGNGSFDPYVFVWIAEGVAFFPGTTGAPMWDAYGTEATEAIAAAFEEVLV